MAGENDQTRWIGIRPTNPAENIPVLTRKLSPAISDLQAIKAQILVGDVWVQGGAADVTRNTPACPVGEIWVISMVGTTNATGTTSHQYHIIMHDGDEHYVNGVLAPAARDFLFTQGPLILTAGDYVRMVFGTLSAGATAAYSVSGYTLGVYPAL